jgi:hypothetical protein
MFGLKLHLVQGKLTEGKGTSTVDLLSQTIFDQLSSKDLLSKLACFVDEENNIFDTKAADLK